MNMDELVKKAQAYLDNEKGMQPKKELNMEDTPNVFGMAPDELAFSVGRLDILVASMWMLMREKGFEDEELMNKITSVIEEQKGVVYRQGTIKCPKCGNNIQEVKKTPLTARCFYCGAMYVLYSFNDKSDSLEDFKSIDNEESSQEVKEQTKEEPAEPELPTHFEPYDVSKDLRFDEFE